MPSTTTQITPYQPWFLIIGVIVFFLLLRLTRKELRKRVDTIGYQLLGEKGLLIWFWMNSPGVMLHELSHAIVVLLFRPFGFRITSIALFRIRPMVQRGANGRVIKHSARQSLQLGEVQYVRPQRKIMSHVGDGLSAIAPLFGGILMLSFLYWVATGYSIWDIHLQLLRPGWPWWTLLFAPYLILTVTSELWPSSQDWHGARWFVLGLTLLILALGSLLYLTHILVFNDATLQATASIAAHFDFALAILLALDIAFLVVAELLMRAVVR